MLKVVGIGEMATSIDKDVILKTYALSSCVAVIAYSPQKRASGLIHVALPASSDIDHIKERPCYYAKTGIPLLIESMCTKYGCAKTELQISLYGGAGTGRHNDMFNIGEKNLHAVKKALQKMQLCYEERDVGGMICRTVEMKVDTGLVKVSLLPLVI